MALIEIRSEHYFSVERWDDQIGGWMVINDNCRTHLECMEDIGQRATDDEMQYGEAKRYRVVETFNKEFGSTSR